MKKIFIKTILIVLMIVSATGVEAATGINRKISFQGKVVNKGVGNTDGTNVTDGNYNMTFSLWTTLSAGSSIWTETWNSGTTQVAVQSGIFQASLGTYQTFPPSVDFNSDSLYLSVNFNGDGDMSPRIQLTAVPYAFNAEKVGGLTVTNTTGTLTIPNGKTIEFGDGFTTTGIGITLNQNLSTGSTVQFAGLSIGGTVAFTNIAVGTGTTVLYIGAGGNLVQGTLPTGTTYSATNGLNLNGSAFGLGGTLTQNTFVNTSSYYLAMGVNTTSPTLHLTSSGDLGVGTSAPNVKLEVIGNIRNNTTSTSVNTIYSTGNGSNGRSLIQIIRNSGTELGWDFGTNVKLDGLDNFTFREVGGAGDTLVRMIIEKITGNVGVGTTNPNYKLEVLGSAMIDGKMGIGATGTASFNVSTDAAIGTNLSVGGSVVFSNLAIGTGTTVLYISATGNLVAGTLPAGGQTYTATNGLNLNGSAFGLGGTLTGNTQIGTSSFNLNIGWGNTQGVFVASNGKVGIGTTDPVYKLEVAGEAMISDRLGIGATNVNFALNVGSSAVNFGGNLQVGGTVNFTGLVLGTGTTMLFLDSSGNIVKGTLPDTGVGKSKSITLAPEYAGASLSADGSANVGGTLTSDNSLNAGGVGWKNYYEWSTGNASLQDYSILVRVQLPADFDTWETGSCPGTTCALEFNFQTGVGTTGDNYLSVQVNNDTDTPGSIVCSIGQTAATAWTAAGCTEATLNDASAPEWDSAGETAIIRIKLAAKNTASALSRAGDLILRYKAKF